MPHPPFLCEEGNVGLDYQNASPLTELTGKMRDPCAGAAAESLRRRTESHAVDHIPEPSAAQAGRVFTHIPASLDQQRRHGCNDLPPVKLITLIDADVVTAIS